MNFFDNLIAASEYLQRAFSACPNCQPKGQNDCPLCTVPWCLGATIDAFVALHQPPKPAAGKDGEAAS